MRPHSEQLGEKLRELQPLLPKATIEFTPLDRVRDRVDLVWTKSGDKMSLGLYGLNSRDVVDIESCPMMSESLESWFKEFREIAPPISRGSVRLRVSPSGIRGVWLDFANQDVKTLFEERSYLEWLSQRAFVEIGQRRKALTWVNGNPKLIDPELRPWFETYASDGSAIPLFGPVGGFSQAGFKANRAMVETVGRLAAQTGINSWVELFCGNGNFALALASTGAKVEAIELDDLAVQGLTRSLRDIKAPWRDNIQLSRLDVYLKTSSLPKIQGRGLIVDPPRAGLREVLRHMKQGWLPEVLLYISCFSESFLEDTKQLAELGYSASEVIGVDQFPNTPHTEWVALFKLLVPPKV